MFKNLLSATDLIETYDPPVIAAFDLAKQNHANLQVLHVLESASSQSRNLVKHFKTGKEIECNDTYEQEVKEEIEKTYTNYFKSYRNISIRVTCGYPFEEISHWAEEIRADLIVIGPHSSRAADQGVVRVKGKIGSTAEGVITNECCPVMIVNTHLIDQKLQFKKIMVSIDFSNSCVCALRFAVKLAQFYDSRICAYHMLPVPPCSQYTQAMYAAAIKIAEEKLETICNDIPTGIAYECNVWGGVHPHFEILKCASSKTAQAIVMGSHTKEQNGKWYVGSTVERVSYRARCPVIVITDPKVLF